MKKKTIIYVFVLCFSKSCSQCEDDLCYQKYENLVENEKDNIQRIFDSILEKYGDVDEDLRNLLNKLNNTIIKAELNLNKLEKDNNDISNRNNLSNDTLLNIIDKAKLIDDELKNISTNPRNWLDAIDDANKTANLLISPIATLNDVKVIEDELEKWRTFLEKFNIDNYAEDIMNIPHSVSDDLLLLETLLDEKHDIKCFSKFHEDLKILFAKLASVLQVDGLNEEIENIKKKATENKKDANEILAKTEDFLEADKKLNEIHDLTKETLVLAEEIDKLKNNIDELSKNKERLFDQKLQELLKSHKKDLKQLYKKYDVDEFEILLDELEDINRQIKDLNNGENTDIDKVEQDIEQYVKEIEYYSCVLEDCRYRKPAEAVTTFNCNQNNN